MVSNTNYNVPFLQFSGGSPRRAFSLGERTTLQAFALAVTLIMMLVVAGGGGVMLHAGDPEQAVASNLQTGTVWSVLDLAASASLSGYAFAQVSDSTPPTFASSVLDIDTMVLTITFSETIDLTPATNVVPTKMHIRESGNYTGGGITLSAGELDIAAADGTEISFILNASRLATVTGLATPELTIEPGAVRDTSDNLIVGTFDASTKTLVNAIYVFEQESNPRGMAFSSDGTKMFVIGVDSGVSEYTLPAPFDTSTPSFVDSTPISREDKPRGIAFSNGGTKMFVIGITGDDVNEYTLSTPFDASTLTFVDATSISLQDIVPTGIAFSNDGTKMFVIDNSEDKVNEYTLSTPFDASTLEFVNATSISSQENEPRDIAFSNDGTKMFVIGNKEDKINEYALSTPFNASTRTFVDATSIRSQETAPAGMAFSNDGAKMFVIGFDADNVNEYALSSVYPVTVTRTPPTFVSSVLDLDAEVLTITFSETIDAANIVPTKIHIRESGNYAGGTTLSAGELVTVADGATISFILNTSRLAAVTGLITPELTIEPGAVRDESGNLIVSTFDASTGKFVDTTPISQENSPQGMAFSSDGTKMFVIGQAGDDVNEYDLFPPFDASTLSFVNATSISEQEDAPEGIAFSNDGTKMFVVGDGVSEYTLSAPFDASTLSFVDTTSASTQEDTPRGIAFSSDGTKMFVLEGSIGGDVSEYALSAPFDASTLSFVDATPVSKQELTPRGIAFSSDGAKMFVIGQAGGDVNEYDLSTPFDASTRSFVDATSVSSRQGAPNDIAFSSDGTRMFVIGSDEAVVTEYALSSVYPIVVGKAPPGAFTTTWNVASSSHTIRISVNVTSGGDLHVDWGDSNTDTFTADGIISHTYSDSGKYQVSMTRDLARINLGNPASTASKLASIDQWGDIAWSSMANAFQGASNMEYRATDAPYLSGVTDMSYMFDGAISFNGDISSWDVSVVTDMPYMFYRASSFNHPLDSWNVSAVTDMSSMFLDAASFNHPLDSWNVSAVTNMSYMFFATDSFNHPLDSWNVSAVTNMNSMFTAADSFNHPLDSWNVSAVTNMNSMFTAADSFNHPLDSWNVSAVTGMESMFDDASSFNHPLDSWNVSAVTNMNSMFSTASSFNHPLDSWDVSAVTGMTDMFSGASSFNQNLGKWYVVPAGAAYDVSETSLAVTTISAQNFFLDRHVPTYGIGTGNDFGLFDMTGDILTFKSAPSIGKYEVNVTASGSNVFENDNNNWRMFNVTVAGLPAGAFVTTWGATDDDLVVEIPVGGTTSNYAIDWGDRSTTTHTAGATHTYGTAGNYTVSISGDFKRILLNGNQDNAPQLLSIDQWGDIEWSSMANAFRGASNMTYKATDAPDLSGVTDMSGMFSGATSFDGDISSWAVLSVEDMNSMFDGAASFDRPLDSWDVSKVTSMNSMFSGATSFNRPLDSWDVSKVTSMNSMFDGAASFDYPLDSWDVSKVTSMNSMFNGAISFDHPLDSWDVSKVTSMNSMFDGAASFDQPLGTWNVSSVTDMLFMLDNAALFRQNLGEWYVVLDDAVISGATETLDIRAQNPFLDGQNPVYDLDMGGDYDLFVVDAATKTLGLDPSGVHYDRTYHVIVTSTGGFGTANYRTVAVTVEGIRSVSVPPTFVSSELDIDMEVLTITFSETIDAANIVPTKIHIRESGNYTHGTTLSTGELDTDADGATISFTLTAPHLAAVAGLTAPKLTIEPGAVRDVSGNLIVDTFDASTRMFVNATSISDQEDAPTDIAFSNDGTKMFVIGTAGKDVNEYDLSAPFDTSTRTFVNATSISDQEDAPTGIAFSSDGAKMFVIGTAGKDVNEYDLSAPFDASTRRFVDATLISEQENAPQGIAFSNDGTKMFVIDSTRDRVNEYALSTPFDASTMLFVDAAGIRSQETAPTGMAFSSDGTKMFVIGSNKDNVNEYSLSTPFDASTRSLVDVTDISSQELAPTGMAFSNDGTKMFVIGFDVGDVNEYALSSVYPVTVTRTPPTFVSSVLDLDAEVLTITFSETIDAANIVPTKIHIRESGNYAGGTTLSTGELVPVDDGSTISFILNASRLATVTGLATPELTIEPGAVRDESGNLIVGTFDASTRKFVDDTDISQVNFPQGIAFSNDGAKMFVLDSFEDDVNEYVLSTPFDASTRRFVDATPISSEETATTGMAFSSDGAKMFVIGKVGDDVNEYVLSTPFDASTLSFVDATRIRSQEIDPTGIAFSSNGTKMFVIGSDEDNVNEYALSTPFDASTRIFVDATRIRSQENTPEDIAFSNDGTKMFVIGSNKDNVNEYALSTPFDASTRIFVDATRIRSQENLSTGMAFSSDGAKMFVIGNLGDDVNEYRLSSVYPVTVTGTPTLPAGAFVTTWNATASQSIISIPVEVHTDGTLTIDWGDGTPAAEVTTNGMVSHTYSASDEYQVSMTGDLSRIILGATGGTPSKLASIDQWGGIEWSSMESAFRGASNMEYKAADAPDLSHVTSMQNMFRDASSFNGNLSDWNVSTVTNMDGTFRGASDFNGDVSSWDTSGATDMRNMFQDADNFDGDISGWDVSKVTDTSSMFYEASDFNQPLNGWDVSKVTDMSYMFLHASEFNQPLNSWNVSAVTDMPSMFFGASTFNGDISDWDVSAVTDMRSMFHSAFKFNQPLNSWNVSSAINMSSMFLHADDFEQNLGEWYILPAEAAYDITDASLNVTVISAQNSILDGHNPTYGIDPDDSHDSGLFSMTGSTLMFKVTPSTGDYKVNVTASGSGVFESGNNWRTLTVTVTGQEDRPLLVDAGPDQRVLDGSTVELQGIVSGITDPTYLWTQNSGSPAVALTDSDTPAPTFTAPDVSSDVDLIFTLTVNDGTDTVTDTVTITVHDAEADFVTTWNNIVTGINLPIRSSAGSFTVDWGDGDISEYAAVTTDRNLAHFYVGSGPYTIRISGDFSEINLQGSTGAAGKLQSIDQWGDIEWTTMAGAFYFAENMAYNAIDAPDLSSVTDMTAMFASTDFSGNLSGWDVSSVTNMNGVFRNSGYTGDLSGWDVSSVTNMNGMFRSTSSFNSDLSGWDVSKVTDMGVMFQGASSFDQNLGNWYVVPADLVYDAATETSLVVTAIATQNSFLDDHFPNYGIGTDGDSDLFSMTGSDLEFKNVPSAGNYTVTVTASGSNVFENGNNWRILDVTVSGEIVNTAPTVNAGVDQDAVEGSDVSLGASVEDDDAEDTLTYTWTHNSTFSITLAGGDTAAPTFTAPRVLEETTIEFTLTVNDGTVDVTDKILVTVTDSANSPPMVNAGNDQQEAEGSTVNLDATVTDTDTEDTLTYTWTHNSTLSISFDDSSAVDTSFTAPNVSEETDIEFTLTVNDGTVDVTDKIIVTITDSANSPPMVNAGNDQQEAEGSTVNLDATVTDTDTEDALTYTWTHNSTLSITLANDSVPDTTFTAPNVSEETDIEFTLTVSDGTATVSDKTIVTITDSPNDPPVVNAGDDQDAVVEGSTVNLDATVTDTDTEDALTYTWTHNSTLSITLANDSVPDTTFTAPNVSEETDIEFTLTVSDGTATVSDKTIVTITDSPNDPPVVNAGDDQDAVVEGSTVNLDATVTDTDTEDALTYTWTHNSTLSITLANDSVPDTTFTAPNVSEETDIEFTLTVSDGTATVSDKTIVTITDSPNDPPVVNAGDDQDAVVEGSTVNLDATVTDTDTEDTLTYTWTHNSTLSITLANDSVPDTTFTAPNVSEETDIEFTLTVSDGTATVSDKTIVTITDSPNDPPVVNAGDDQDAVVEGSTVNLDATVTDTDTEDALTYTWTHNSTLSITLANDSVPDTTFTAPNVLEETDIEFTLTVSDGTATVSDKTIVTITDSPNDPPVVNAGDDQDAVVEGSTVNLDATVTDADTEDALTYTWTHNSTLSITLANDSVPDTTFTAPNVSEETDIEFTLTVSDGTATVSDKTIVTITDSPNDPPVVNAGDDQDAVVEGSTVNLDATVTDADTEDALTYTWTHNSTLSITLANDSVPDTTFTAPNVSEETDIEFTLTVSDGTATVSDKTIVTITDSPNDPPVVNAGDDQDAVVEGSTVNLDATVTDTDTEDALTYTWTHNSTLSITLANDSVPDTTFTAPNVSEETDIEFTLTVSDGTATVSDKTIVTITDSPNDPPVVNAGDDQDAVVEGSTVNLDATVTDTDTEDALTYTWTHNSTLSITLANDSVPDTTFTAPNVSEETDIEFTLTVSDGTATVSDKTIVTITDSPNDPPVVNAGDDQDAVVEGSTVNLDATVTDTDTEDALTYTWTHNSTLSITLANDSVPDTTFTAPNVSEETDIEFTLTVSDGTATVSDKTIVTITDSPNDPPVVNAGDDQDAVVEGSTVNLDATVTDTDTEDALTYTWTHNSTLSITLANDSVPDTTFTAPNVSEETDIEFTLTVSDGTATVSDKTIVTITDSPNDPPVVNAGDDQDAVVEGSTVNLDATVTDTDTEDALTYTWTHNSTLSITLANDSVPDTTFTAPNVSEETDIEFTLTVSDGTATVSDKTIVTITDSPNDPPVVNAGDDQDAVVEGSTVNLDATVTDDDTGDTLTYTWTHNSTLSISFDDSSAVDTSFTAPNVSEETDIEFTLTVNDGTVDVTDKIIVTITDSANSPPMVNAGNDQQEADGSTVNLDATVTDTDTEDTLTYTWTHNSTLSISFDDSSAVDTSFTAPNVSEETDIEFTLTVNDGTVDVTDKIIVTITDSANSPPMVNAGNDQQEAEGSTVNLDATVTDDDTEDTLTYTWTHNSTLSISLDDSSAVDTTFTAPNVAENTVVEFTLTVYDGTATVSDKILVTITDSANSPPEVNAGNDQQEAEGSTVSLDATVTDDDTEDTLTYTWTHNSTLSISLDDSSAVDTTFTAPNVSEETDIEFTLTVNDGTVDVTDKIIVTITDSANSPPMVNAGNDQQEAEGSTVSLDATVTDDDTEDTLTYTWTHNSTLSISLDDSSAVDTTFTAPNVAENTVVEFTLTVYDGTATVSDKILVTITDSANSPPEVNAGNDQQEAEGSTVSLDATVTDDDTGDTLTYTWTHNSTLSISLDDSSAVDTTFTAPNVSETTVVEFTLTVYDGTATVSDKILVTITDSANSPPEVNAGNDQQEAEGSTVSLDATVTDDDTEDTLTYTWTHNSTLSISLDDSSAVDTTFTAPNVSETTVVEFTLTVYDGTATVSDKILVTITDSANSPPEVNAGNDQQEAEGSTVSLDATVTDDDTGDTLTYTWTHNSTLSISLDDSSAVDTTFTAPNVSETTVVEFTLTVYDGTATVSDKILVTITDSANSPPEVNAGNDQQEAEGSTVSLDATVTDDDTGDTLTYTWTHNSTLSISLDDSSAVDTTFTAPNVSETTVVEFTLTVYDGTATVSDKILVTITDSANSPPEVNAGNDQQEAEGSTVSLDATVTDDDTGDTLTYTWTHNSTLSISLDDSSAVDTTFTAPNVSETTVVEFTLTVSDGTASVSDEVLVTITDSANSPLAADASRKNTSSSSSKAPAVHISALAQARIVDIPPHIAEQVASHDASDPLEPIVPDGTFDFPLVINGYGYLLDDTTNTLVPQTVAIGDGSTIIAFTVYTQKDLAYFTLYLNLSDENIDYADSDTYITYKDDGTTSITDPHGYIDNATITVTQEDDSVPERKTVRITVEFGEEPMGPTNMVAYMWNTDRKAVFIKIIDAFEVVAALLEPVVQAADPEPLEPDSVLPADPEPVAPDFADDAADPEPISSDTLWPDDYEEAQVLHIIRMWSGFESEFITDTQLLELLGLEDYQDVDLPDWMMTELGVLVAKGDVTVDEFVLALQYVLENL